MCVVQFTGKLPEPSVLCVRKNVVVHMVGEESSKPWQQAVVDIL